jgi:hypothetical protein
MTTAAPNALFAGAACVDITPPPGTHLGGSGMGEHRPAQSVLDPLYAKALVLQRGDRRLCVVTLDATIVTAEYTARIRSGITAHLGVAPEAILVHAIQTHSAPSLGHFMLDPDYPLETTPETEYLRGAESAYSEQAAAGAVEAAREAARRLQPARLAVGRGLVGDLAFNRRGVRRDGAIMMPKPLGRERQPLGITDLCYLEGPSDPEVGVLCIQDLSMRPLALVLHFTCHPVNVFGQRETYYAVSADWPGAWSQALRAAYGAQVVPLVLNGCCGNINPWHPFDPECRPDHRRMGSVLAEMSGRVLHSLRFTTDVPLDWRCRELFLPYREIPPSRQQEVADILSRHPQPPRGPNGDVDPRWFLAASTRSVELCRRREPEFRYGMQALRLGDTAIVGLPGEPFVEGQLRIKTASAAPFCFVAHLVSQYVGYLPTREAYARGGHEANAEVTYWAKLAPGCLETVVEAARDMVAELFAAPPLQSARSDSGMERERPRELPRVD